MTSLHTQYTPANGRGYVEANGGHMLPMVRYLQKCKNNDQNFLDIKTDVRHMQVDHNKHTPDLESIDFLDKNKKQNGM